MLPVARIHPQNRTERIAVLASVVRERARKTGRYAAITAKLAATIALCSAGFLVVAAKQPRRETQIEQDLARIRANADSFWHRPVVTPEQHRQWLLQVPAIKPR